MEKARADLQAARILLVERLFHQSLNRSYYAIFNATKSLLALDEFDSRKHSGIISYFNKNYVASGIFGKEMSKILMGAERIRNKSDYDDFYVVSVQEAESQIEQAAEFLDTIDKYILKRIG
jgi:hypothetical protein